MRLSTTLLSCVVVLGFLSAASIPGCNCNPATVLPDGGDDGATDGPVVPDDGATDADLDASDGTVVCANDAECQDDVFCNGAERCSPGSAGADGFGCAAAAQPACMASQLCLEDTDVCQTQCEIDPDADDDGEESVDCGGTDCDDSDELVNTGASDASCNDVDDDCDGNVDDEYLPVACSVPGQAGPCASSTSACLGGAEVCPQTVFAQPETCNAVDDDCDGVVNDGNPGGGAPCLVVGQQGACAVSALSCGPNDTAPVCLQTVQPTAELCNSVDDDCDGFVNDGNPGGGAACTVSGQQGVCATGALACGAADATPVCVQTVQPSAEQCNGLDDDCDGIVNDGNPGGGGACTVPGQLGICANSVYSCGANDTALVCNQTVFATNEVCNALDDDCDGIVNDGNPGGGGACTVPGLLGICASSVYSCGANDTAPVCGQTVFPQTEVCNALDDDCDGVVNDGNPGGGGPCTVPGQLGVCATGALVCGSTETTPICVQTNFPMPETCNALDDDCDGIVNDGNPGGGAACSVPGQLGICANSVLSCGANDTAPVCNQTVFPGTEVCNALDDDCDGVVNDGNPGGGAPCAVAGQLGVCGTGALVCGATETTPVCVQTNFPMAETCNSLDDDCDGVVNDGNPGGGGSCAVAGQAGACQQGMLSCGASDSSPVCVQVVFPSAEICNAVDDDCDGVVNDGNPGGGAACTVPGQFGICATSVLSCGANDTTPVCNQTVFPGTEVCNALDDDCDGVVNDGNPGGGGACTVAGQLGVCAAGQLACGSANTSPVCTQVVFPTPETCNALDDDCDGVVNDGNPGGGGSCSVAGQVGVCQTGVLACGAGNTAPVCTQSVSPSNEICNGADDDCDGSTDENNPGGGAVCNTGNQGVCAAGTTSCTNGAIACNQNVQPSTEVCDGVDNDCDGAVDEGNPGGGLACNTGQLGICAAGTTLCQNGAIVCSRNLNPTIEVCDGLDNNCSGTTDEGNPGGGLACSTGLVGVCSVGITACTNGAPTCNQLIQPSAEICDGADNDCDGFTDENNPGGGVACNTGEVGVCSAGTTACSGGSLLCNRTLNPSNETCDNLDNDCDGFVDEGNPGGGGACVTGQPGVCSSGTLLCSSGALVCNRNTNPSSEICDSLDNDCNGAVDDNATYTADGIPNTCAQAGGNTVSIGAYGASTVSTVTGRIATQDDYFRVNFTSVGTPGNAFHPRVRFLDDAGGQFRMEILNSSTCGLLSSCTSVNDFEMLYPANPNNCLASGKCTDTTPRITTLVVHVFRPAGPPTNCSSYTIEVSNRP